MKINLRKHRSYWLRDAVVSERFVLGAMRKLVRTGDVVFDAGANIGLHVRFLTQIFGASKVVAFEPAQQNLPFLRNNIRLGDCENHVQIMPVALADFDGIDEFQIDDVSSASGALNVVTKGQPSEARRQYGFMGSTEAVPVARVDTLVRRGDVPVPTLIKIDVEGAEARLLRGATETLKKHAPNLIIELHGAEVAQAVVKLLLGIGYHVFGYLDRGGAREYNEIKEADILAITAQYSLEGCLASRNRELLRSHADYITPS